MELIIFDDLTLIDISFKKSNSIYRKRILQFFNRRQDFSKKTKYRLL